MTRVIRQTGCTFSRRLRRQATVVTQCSEALRTMYPTRRSREADGISESNTRYGTSLGCMVNISELLINPVTQNKPKLLIGLGQKGKWYGCNVGFSLHKVSESTGEQAEPKHSMSSLRNVETPTIRPEH